jgi:eukaryotic-like serine/threonine-protein kinase
MTVFVGRYRIVRTLGSGGMAEVLAAHDERLGRDVAIKLIRPELLTDPSSRERLLREARSAAALHHPNTVTVFDAGEEDGRPYIVMQLVDGETLADRLRRDAPLPLDEAVEVGMAIVAGLQAAHDQGIVHRDVKPSNVLLSTDGDIKLADFGIAKALDASDPSLTMTGAMLGTPRYLSPEQAAGKEATPASDQYSLGAVLYECFTGRPPFEGDSAVAVVLAHQQQTPVPLAEVAPHVPPGIAAVVERALAKDPADRFADVAELGAALADGAMGGGAGAATVPMGGPPAAATQPMVGAAAATMPLSSTDADPSSTAVLGAAGTADPAGTSTAHGTPGGNGPDAGEQTFNPRRTRLWWVLGVGALALLLAVAFLPDLLGDGRAGDGSADPAPEAPAEDGRAADPESDPEADPDTGADAEPNAEDGPDPDDEVEGVAAEDGDAPEALPDPDDALTQLDELIADLARDPDAAGQHGSRLLRNLMDIRDEEDEDARAEDAREQVREIASWLTRDHIERSYAEAAVPVLAAIGTPEGEGLGEVAELFTEVALDKEAWGRKAKDLLDDLDDLIGEDPEDRPQDAADIIDEIDEWIEKDELDAERGRRAQQILAAFAREA